VGCGWDLWRRGRKLALNTKMIWTTLLRYEGGRWDLALTLEALRLILYFFLDLIGYMGPLLNRGDSP